MEAGADEHAALPTSPDRWTVASRMRRTHRYTFAPNGWLRSRTRDGTGLWGTQILTVGCPDDFSAVRIGFPNITASPFTIPKISVVASTSWNDLANPTGGATPRLLTAGYEGAGHEGAGHDEVGGLAGATSLIVLPVPTNAVSGESSLANWTWTDWCGVSSTTPDPATQMRVLMIRHTADNNAGNPVTYCNGAFGGWSGVPSINNGYDYFCGGLNNGSDHTAFDVLPVLALVPNSLVNGSLIGAVQFMTRNAGIAGMTTGDSHHMGTTTTASFNAYLAQAVTLLGKANIGAVPFGFASTAIGGIGSRQMFGYLEALLPHIEASYVILPGWTANELNGSVLADDVACDRFFARLLLAAEAVRANGAIPIWLTPFPRQRSFMMAPQLQAWRELRQRILALQAGGEVIVDATGVLGRVVSGDFDGTYLPGLSTDHVHPNDAGHAAVAGLLMPVIQRLMG